MRYQRTDFSSTRRCLLLRKVACQPSLFLFPIKEKAVPMKSSMSVDTVEKLTSALLQQMPSFPAHSELCPGPQCSPGHQKGWHSRGAPVASTCITLHHRCGAENRRRLGASHPEAHITASHKTSVLPLKLWRFGAYPLLLSDFFLQDPVVVFTSAEYLEACVSLEAVSALSSLSQIEDFPIRGGKGVIYFPVIFGCDDLQELQQLQPWNSSPE